MTLTEEQVAAYIEGKGLKCPLCGGDIESEGPANYFDSTDEVYYLVQCATCSAFFTETYRLVSLELEAGEEPE